MTVYFLSYIDFCPVALINPNLYVLIVFDVM